jgi:hypothetical protein
MQKIAKLNSFIWEANKKTIGINDDSDCKDLATRYWLAYGVPVTKRKESWWAKLKEYADYRYVSGSFQLAKSVDKNKTDQQQYFHPTLEHILSEIELLLKEKADLSDLEILEQLRKYILESDIKKAITC